MALKMKSIAELDRIREVEAKIQEKLRKEFVPEKNEWKPMAYFEVGRYTKGPFLGLFIVTQLITEENGKKLKKPIRKVLTEGVDMLIAMSYLETALRRRVFK